MGNSKRYRSVDVVKGIAMIMVILVHYGQNYNLFFVKALNYLRMGCPAFFVASGFGIMCLVSNKFGGQLKKNNIGSFYFSRFKALAPGWYITFIIVFFINSLLLYFVGKTLTFGTNRGFLSIVCNLLFLNGVLPFCNNNVMPGGWYIGTTAVLYLLTPLILYSFSKTKNKRLNCLVLSFIAIGIWIVLFLAFRKAFTTEEFGYFFFLIHFPEYLLGILLFYNISSQRFSERYVKYGVPLSIVALIIAIVFFYIPIPFSAIPSAWFTALATYFALNYMIPNEKTKESNIIDRVLEKYGRNSYCIFLLHTFWAYPFVRVSILLLERIGVPNIISFFILIPITLFLAYLSGFVLSLMIRKISKGLLRNTS